MQTVKYVRKPFEVEAVQVTEENWDEIVAWTGGQTLTDGEDGQGRFIKVPVTNPINEKQTQAVVGDWVLKASSGFKVYSNKAFMKSFEPKAEQPQELRTVTADGGSARVE